MPDASPAFTAPLFFCPTTEAGDEIFLTGDEAHHVTVQRLRAGDDIALFDGKGNVVRGTIRAISRNDVRVNVEQRHHEPRPLPELDLYCALPKGERLSVLLDMATQLGMSCFTPVRWSRSVSEPGPRSLERWRRICLEACKQSRRAHLPEIKLPMTLAEATVEAAKLDARLLVAHPHGDATPLKTISGPARRVALFVGPEGGITNDETQALREHNATFVNLGQAILRIETAAVVLLAAMRHIA